MQNTNPRKTFLNFRNSLLTLYKNDQSAFRFLKILLRLLLDGLAFIKLMVDSGPKHAFAIPKAHFSFYGMKKLRSAQTTVNRKGIYRSSIVLEFYLFGKKKFSQLKKGII